MGHSSNNNQQLLFFYNCELSLDGIPNGFICKSPLGLVATMKMPDELLPEGWTQTQFGDPVCPHGNPMEQDGSAPCGCESPLKSAGLI